HFMLICPSPKNLLRRLPIMKLLLENEHTVDALYASETEECELRELKEIGINLFPISMVRGGKSLFLDFKQVSVILKLMNVRRPDVVHTFTVQPNIFGTLAAHHSGRGVIINSVTGIGSVHIGSGASLKAKFKVRILNSLYRSALQKSDAVIFQNDADKD